MSAIGAIIVILLIVAAYLAPSVIAVTRDIPNKYSVVVINILLGWTFIGWVVALAMSARDASRVSDAPTSVALAVNAHDGNQPVEPSASTSHQP